MTQSVLSVTDFDRILDNYAGRQVSHIKTTQTVSNLSGQETLTEAEAVTIKSYFMRTNQNWDFAKFGFTEKGDAVVLAKYADSVSKDDIISVEGNKFRIKEAFDVPGVFDSTGSGTSFTYTACNLFLVE